MLLLCLGVVGLGIYALIPYLVLRTDSDSHESDIIIIPTPRLTNTMSGMGKGF